MYILCKKGQSRKQLDCPSSPSFDVVSVPLLGEQPRMNPLIMHTPTDLSCKSSEGCASFIIHQQQIIATGTIDKQIKFIYNKFR